MTDEALIDRMARAIRDMVASDDEAAHAARAALDVIRSEYALVSREKLDRIGSRIAAAGKET